MQTVQGNKAIHTLCRYTGNRFKYTSKHVFLLNRIHTHTHTHTHTRTHQHTLMYQEFSSNLLQRPWGLVQCVGTHKCTHSDRERERERRERERTGERARA